MYICTYVRTYVRTYVPTYIHTYIHTYFHKHNITLHYITLHYITLHYFTYIHTYVCVYILMKMMMKIMMMMMMMTWWWWWWWYDDEETCRRHVDINNILRNTYTSIIYWNRLMNISMSDYDPRDPRDGQRPANRSPRPDRWIDESIRFMGSRMDHRFSNGKNGKYMEKPIYTWLYNCHNCPYNWGKPICNCNFHEWRNLYGVLPIIRNWYL